MMTHGWDDWKNAILYLFIEWDSWFVGGLLIFMEGVNCGWNPWKVLNDCWISGFSSENCKHWFMFM